MRNLFDAENFKEKVINDDEKITIHALVPHHNQQAKLLIQWLEKGVFDALNKKFVETITFAIYGYVNNADKATLMVSCLLIKQTYLHAVQL